MIRGWSIHYSYESSHKDRSFSLHAIEKEREIAASFRKPQN